MAITDKVIKKRLEQFLDDEDLIRWVKEEHFWAFCPKANTYLNLGGSCPGTDSVCFKVFGVHIGHSVIGRNYCPCHDSGLAPGRKRVERTKKMFLRMVGERKRHGR